MMGFDSAKSVSYEFRRKVNVNSRRRKNVWLDPNVSDKNTNTESPFEITDRPEANDSTSILPYLFFVIVIFLTRNQSSSPIQDGTETEIRNVAEDRRSEKIYNTKRLWETKEKKNDFNNVA